MIKYIDNIKNIHKENIKGFFVDWPNPPLPEKHLQILKNSDYIWLAIDDNNNRVVGFITAISDKILSSYIPLLEVLPEYKNRGIGSKLVEKMLETLNDYYMVDLVCDKDLLTFYSRFKMLKGQSMIIRNYKKQNGGD